MLQPFSWLSQFSDRKYFQTSIPDNRQASHLSFAFLQSGDLSASSGIFFHIPSNFSLLLPAFQIHLFSHILSSNRPAALWFCDTMIFLQKRQLSFPLTLSPAAFLSVSFCSHSFSLLVSIQPPIKRIAWDTIRSANLQHPEWFSIIINIFYKFIRLGASQPKQILNIFYFIYFLFHFILYHCHDVILLVLIFALYYR